MGYKLTAEELVKIEVRDGWYWPFKDKSCWPWMQNEKDNPEIISRHCVNKRTVIQAGGNVGFYVRPYAELFERVITFEPDRLNFQCLTMNVENENVIKIQACVGNNRQPVKMITSRKNIGCYHVDPKEVGLIPTLLIDDFNVEDCDLIHLDIEGYELFALQGAEQTIRRCRPVIALEWMNHGVKNNYDSPDSEIEKYLESLGYTVVEDFNHDRIFKFVEPTDACDANNDHS